MTADPYARLDAAYLLGALDADERLAILAYGVSRLSGLRIASQARSLAPAYADLHSGRDGPGSQGRWLVSLTQWTAANPRPCHWISLMQAEPRYSR
jgi:hypothetical protein